MVYMNYITKPLAKTTTLQLSDYKRKEKLKYQTASHSKG